MQGFLKPCAVRYSEAGTSNLQICTLIKNILANTKPGIALLLPPKL